MTELFSDGTKKISLSSDQFASITAELGQFYRSTKCQAVMLSDVSGLSIAQSGKMDSSRMMLLSTVAAGNYAATKEMARLIGEDAGFKVQFHEGKENNVYVCDVDESFFLVVVFGRNTTFGMIRVRTGQTIDTLCEVLRRAPQGDTIAIQRPIEHEVQQADFQTELSARLDKVLFSKEEEDSTCS